VTFNSIGTYGTSYRQLLPWALGGLGANLPEVAITFGRSAETRGKALFGSAMKVINTWLHQ
jgi:hypothetical protein